MKKRNFREILKLVQKLRVPFGDPFIFLIGMNSTRIISILICWLFLFSLLTTGCVQAIERVSRNSNLINTTIASPIITSRPTLTRTSQVEQSNPTDIPTMTLEPYINKGFHSATSIPLVFPGLTDSEDVNKKEVELSSDLLYLAGKELVRWDPRTQYGVVLANDVKSFSLSNSGMAIALKRTRNVSVNGVSLFDLDILNLKTKQINNLVRDFEAVDQITLSPDGTWLAFTQNSKYKKIQALHISGKTKIKEIGSCVALEPIECSDLKWSPDSKKLLWTDSRGIWISSPEDSNPLLINPGKIGITDPHGKTSEMDAWFNNPIWSPIDRFVLLEVSLSRSPVYWHIVLDSRNGRIHSLHDTYRTDSSNISISWLSNGSLAVAHASNPKEFLSAEIEIWNLVPTNPELFVLKSNNEITARSLIENLVLADFSVSAPVTLCLEWLHPLDSTTLLFRIRLLNSSIQPILARIDLQDGKISPIAEVVIDVKAAIWAEGGSGLLILSSEGELTFISPNNQEKVRIPVDGDVFPEGIAWLPPNVRD